MLKRFIVGVWEVTDDEANEEHGMMCATSAKSLVFGGGDIHLTDDEGMMESILPGEFQFLTLEVEDED